jgi:dual specificity tyrosine-phosphorylation-regulated kinase 2/3/4
MQTRLKQSAFPPPRCIFHWAQVLNPKRTSLRHRLPDADEGLLEFVSYLLCVDPRKRPSAAEALGHPWLRCAYASLS